MTSSWQTQKSNFPMRLQINWRKLIRPILWVGLCTDSKILSHFAVQQSSKFQVFVSFAADNISRALDFQQDTFDKKTTTWLTPRAFWTAYTTLTFLLRQQKTWEHYSWRPSFANLQQQEAAKKTRFVREGQPKKYKLRSSFKASVVKVEKAWLFRLGIAQISAKSYARVAKASQGIFCSIQKLFSTAELMPGTSCPRFWN